MTPDDNGRSTIPHPVYSFGSKPNSEMVQSPPTMNTFGTGLSQGLSQDPFPIPHQPHTGSQASYRTHAQDNVPSFNSRQESFSSDDWQKISPPLTSASNGKALGSGLRAYAKTGSQSRSIKQEEVSSGKPPYFLCTIHCACLRQKRHHLRMGSTRSASAQMFDETNAN